MTTTESRLRHDPDGLNASGHPIDLAGSHDTPLEHFFTRSHAPIPSIDAATWRLEVTGMVATPLSLSLDALRSFPRREVASTLLCAGLRRDELLRLGPLPGELPWGPEAASHARWTGASLRDVLQAAGVSPDAAHVHFTGLDTVERKGERFGFGGSITIGKALDPDVLLAYGMHGHDLPVPHGFPVRTIVPGWIGARSVKWLGRINVAAEPSSNYFQTKAYRVVRTPDPAQPGDVSAGDVISGITLNSVILDPRPGQRVPAGSPVALRGWAIGTDGSAVSRIEYSTDDGRSWHPAATDDRRERWSWTRWSATVDLEPGTHTLAVRAFDASGQSQPSDLREAWNVKGYLNNAWHRVRVIAE
ncbi:MAG: sulfite oxidase [Gemmatimonadaceae bacterium]|nr:sulfite oxidase [Gemmatimonadaceae bacterium]